ncbi:MAG: HAMP domain-containing histidine kinase [Gammaproteobacteria bacterium]|nr:HAMP domain-containing histidine kinase [Gammaproteobacteria bacterium]
MALRAIEPDLARLELICQRPVNSVYNQHSAWSGRPDDRRSDTTTRMRIALKNTLALLALYFVLVIGLGVVLRAELGAAVFDRIYASMLLAALAGLASIIVMGALLQVQLKRMGAGLAALMEAVATGDNQALTQQDDEFAAVRHAAGWLGEEIKAARGQTAQARDKLNAVANVFDVGVILITPGGSPDYINKTARQILISDRAHDFEARFTEMYAELKEAVGKVCQDSAGESLANIELTTGKAGATKRLRVHLHALSSPDNRGCLLIVKDRDLIDALDEDLRAATRARGLSRLYAAAAHDLKAPLNAMSLNMEMLKRSLDAGDGNARERRQHYLKVVSQESARLNRLLNTLLEQGAPAAEGRTTVDLARLIDELEILLTPQARHQQVTFDIDLPVDVVQVFGNASQLKQALLNIILNALECVTENGRVGVSLRTEASSALIEIEDNGAGIPASLQASIFDMHFTTKDTGTGIGLYVARAVMQRHGGEIRVNSRSGAGTRFILSLPLHGAGPTARQDAPPEITRISTQ